MSVYLVNFDERRNYALIVDIGFMLSLIVHRVLQVIWPPDDDAKRRADSTSHDQLLDIPYRSSLTMYGKETLVSLQSSRTMSSLNIRSGFLRRFIDRYDIYAFTAKRILQLLAQVRRLAEASDQEKMLDESKR